jgi:CubicO group peptidase (beta-lactamase class C family)
MTREDVKGMAVAIVEDVQVAHVAAFGRRNMERKLPLKNDTVMCGASLTKTAFAFRIRQNHPKGGQFLARQGRSNPTISDP